jgi:hypothetical protein
MRRALPLLLVVAAFFIAGAIWINSSRVASHTFEPGSALNTSPAGTSLAYSYLGHRGMVKMLTTQFRSAAVPQNAVVFRFDTDDDDSSPEEEDPSDKKTPLKTPPPLITPAEDEFVRGGGRLILANRGVSIDTRNDAGKVATKVFPIWPSVDTLSLPEPLGFVPRSLPRGMHTIFAANGEAVVARQAIGAGDVIVISVPEMFENQHLAADHHLALLTALAAEPLRLCSGQAPAVQPASRRRYEHRPIYFDEYAHGIASDDGALALMTEWRLGPLLVLGGIAALFTFWHNARRIGLPDAEERDTRSDAIDLVASLGALYGRSMTNSDAIALYRAALERTVAAQSGLRGDALHRRVAELTHGLTPPTGVTLAAHAFDRHLNAINDAFRTLERTARGGQHANHR